MEQAQLQIRTHFDLPTFLLFSFITVVTIVAVPLYGYLYGYSTLDWVLFSIFYVMSGLGITVGYHRLVSHRSFECPNWVKGVLLISGGWALENSALRWGSDHIRHHARTDQDEDPYNAQKGFWHSHCGWVFLKSTYRDPKYEITLRRDPVIMWQHRWYLPILLSGWLIPFFAGLLAGGIRAGVGAFLLAGIGRTFFVLNSTFCINSVCHMWGNQPHGSQDSSRDSWLVSLITFGEGYHNYHHTHLRDYRNGPKWYNFDPSKWLIFLLSKLGLASNLHRAQPSTY
jgi:stearoyl-CoA desaturase (delta-9 desaturase)